MPRTIATECPGCPAIRVLTTDELGLIKVVEGHGKASFPKIVETWGKPDAFNHVLLTSLADRKRDPVLAVARKNNQVEFLNPLNGDVLAVDKVSEAFPDNQGAGNDLLAGLHLFSTNSSESRLDTILMCTENGKVCLRSISLFDDSKKSPNPHSLKLWDICNAGKVLCCSVDGSEKYVAFSGKRLEVNLWDIESTEKIWAAKSPRANSLGIFTPACFTATTFLCGKDHRKIAASTNNHQVRLYDIAAQRRPVTSVEFGDSPIRAIAEDPDGFKIYVGTGKGDLASFDMRTGKLLGSFKGKCSGSIRSIKRHPRLPVIVSCGLDRYLRFWDANTRELLSAVFLKQILTSAVIDSEFSDEETAFGVSAEQQYDTVLIDQDEVDISEAEIHVRTKKVKDKKPSEMLADAYVINADHLHAAKRTSSHEKSKKLKHKRRKKGVSEDD